MEVEVGSRMLDAGGRSVEHVEARCRLVDVDVDSRMTHVGGRDAELVAQ